MNVEVSTRSSKITGFSRPVQIRHLNAMGYRVRVAVWPGDKGHTPLLMFNGIGAGFELLVPFAEVLGEIEIIALDVPGAGESATPLHLYRIWMVSILASHVLTQLGYDRVDVLGLSWGGTLAQQFALQNPIRCRRLILAATMQGFPMKLGRLSVLRKMITPRRFNDPAYRQKIAGEIYGGLARTEPQFIRELGPLIRHTSKLGYLLQQLALVGWTSLPWLAWLHQPTLILAGDDDPIIPLVNARVMASLIPRSRLHVFHDGHLFLLSSKDQAGRVVRKFLDVDAQAA